MLLDVLGLFVILIVGAVAFGSGLWFANNRAASTTRRPSEDTDDIRRAREALAKIHDVASRVAADVDEHSTRVREINDELGAKEAGEAEVVAAISKLIASNEHMQQQLSSAEKRLQQQAVEIKTHAHEARTDALTKAPNRRALDLALGRCVADFNRDGRTTSLVMIDIDHFKKVNDFYGHQAGDAVLAEAAQVIKRALPEPAFVGRYGGEEFAVILPGVSISDAVKKAEHARRQIQQARFMWRGKELRVTVSTGVAAILPGDDAAKLIGRADKALYQSKQTNRNCGHWHDGETIHRIGLDHVIATKKRVATEPPQNNPATGASDDSPSRSAAESRPAGATPEPAAAVALPAAIGEQAANTAQPINCPPLTPVEEAAVLSKLSDRESFTGDVRRRLMEWGRGGAPVAVVMIRVEDYDEIVEQRGPDAGEAALKTCAQFIQAAMRDLDHVARWSTDCFALLLPGSRLAGAQSVAERLKQAISRCRERTGGKKLGLAIQSSVAEASDGDDTDALLARCAASLDAGSGRAENQEVDPEPAPRDADDVKPAAVGSPSA